MIAILSDFNDSEYLGVMKGVIYSISKDAKIVDLYNRVNSQNVKEGAWILFTTYKYFPKKTVFLCVVDPGVGSEREAIAIKTKNYFFIGPDNGLLWPTINEDSIKEVVKLSTKNASLTFHGRDVFAKAAALLDKNQNISSLGKKTEIKAQLSFHLKEREGEIVRIDNFGNIITNLPSPNKDEYNVKVNNINKNLKFYKTYNEAKENELFLIEGSSKTLEISIKNGNASKKLNINI